MQLSKAANLLASSVPTLLNSLVCTGWRSLSFVLSLLSDSTQTGDGRLGSDGSGRRQHVCTTSDLPVRGLALPDASSDSLDGLLSTEGADVLGSLGDFEFLHDLTEGSTIAAAVLSADSNLLCSLCHYYLIFNNKRRAARTPNSKKLSDVKHSVYNMHL